MLDFEVSGATFWVAVDEGVKPIPVHIHESNGEWKYETIDNIDPQIEIHVQAFFKDRLGEMQEIWKANMKRRLTWSVKNLGKKAKKK